MAPYPGQARCLALGFWPERFRRLDVKGGRRPFPEETRSALDIEGKHVTIQGAIPGPGPSHNFCPFPLHAITDAGDRTYGGTVVSATYRDLFATVATAAGALTGLLFVALSLVPRRASGSGLSVIQQVRAAAAFLAFTNALAVALFGLVPGTNVGYPALVLGVIGIAFTVAGIRSILASQATSRQQLRQVGLVVLLLLIFGTELIAGIVLLARPDSSTSAQVIGYALVASLLVGVARSWELVGARDTGLIASIMTLAAGRAQGKDDEADDPDGAVSSGSEDSPGNELLRTESGE
jgi:hypothetical protein